MKKKRIWIKLIFFLIAFSLFSSSFIIYTTKYSFENNYGENNLIKTSDNEISIITPENKVYTEPMSGYYLASYGFESDPLGLWHPPNPPFDSTILNPINMTIVKDQFGHKKVLKLIDCSAIDIVDLAYTVSPSDLDDGTIEFWWATNDTSKYGWHIFDLYRHVYPYSIGYMELNGGKFHMRSNTEFLDHSVIPQNNTWYHIRVDWSRYGGYQGLSARRYKVTIDGTEGPELIFNQNNNAGMRYIRFSTGSIEKDYEWYIDAVGVSTDINYNAGDNLNEGLLLSFDNSTTLDWMGYSLDGLANKTILGNTTLPLPVTGAHNIQVFGNDSLGAMYASDLRYFTLNLPIINIITPENKTYTEPMSGYYPATYGFENDEIGSVPQGWIDSSLGSGVVEVIQEKDQHKNVLHIQSSSTIDNHGVALLELEDLTSGTVEYWIKFDNANPPAHYIYAFDIRENLDIKVAVRIVANEWTYYDGSVYQSICPAEAYKWYRLRVTWDMVSDTSDIYVYHADNTLAGSVIGATNAATGTTVNRLYIAMNNAVVNTNIWVDAVGVSWDPNYNLGDNSNEGMMLSFDNSTTLDWKGYSLDGLANKTIIGNTTLPMPLDGTHNIQVFGNNSLGTMYASNLRYFTINITNYIEILTPENKTYSAPMSGYYPATYGFEHDDDGSDPEGWILNENPPNFEIEVVSEKQGHKKVVHFYDNENAWRSMNHYPDGNPTTGTIELWVLGVDVTDYRFDIGLWDTTMRRGFVVIIADDKWQYFDGGYHDVPNVGIPQDNTWHQLRIDFRCAGAPTYEGLSMASYKIIVDGIESGEIPFWEPNTNHLERLSIGTDAAPNSEWWVDAISFSWDPNYNIGDNLNEGLLLSFDNYPRLDWIGYSLDGLANKTISGNTTLPLPANGSHNIQVFGNDSLGTTHASNLRYFTLDVPMISISTPENKTYTEPMSGYYPATYGFENDKLYTLPQEWSEPAYYSPKTYVIPSLNGHFNVFQIFDDTSSHDISVLNNFTAEQQFGTIELWCAVSDVTQPSPIGINLRDEFNVHGPSIAIRSGYFAYHDGVWRNIIPAISNQWYHLRMVFRCNGSPAYEGLSENCYYLYINQIKYGEFSFRNTANNAVKIAIGVGTAAINSAYIDAVGYAWDPNYAIGDNLNEGLLLSFENRTTLDWMGYSLDGLTNKTIMGDVTIPFLSNGPHSIQVFGNGTLGTIYESEIRYFSINVPPPSISIITPSNDEFYSNIAPSFSVSITAFYQITTWYTLDGGGTNITFTGSSGTINQTEWDGQGEGPVTIRFYVNDSFGGFDYAEITINKDVTDPVITINSPLFGDQFTTMPPRFNISVDELNIDAMWYTIDGGLTTYNISEYSGYIDSIAWNIAPNGAITIRFYVKDKAGNEDYEDVIVQKSTPPYIPPDNNLIIISFTFGILSILIGFSLIFYIILRRKRKYEPSKFKELKKPEIRVKAKGGYLMCPYCHNENYFKHRYCIYCGSSLADLKPNNV